MLKVIHNSSQNKSQVCLSGELGIETVLYFNSQMQNVQTYSPKEIDIDFGGLSFIDSTGVRALLNVLKEITGEGQIFKVINISEEVYNILELIGLIQMFGNEKFLVK